MILLLGGNIPRQEIYPDMSAFGREASFARYVVKCPFWGKREGHPFGWPWSL